MDEQLKEIFDAAELEVKLNHQVGTNHQELIEETIMNLAALKALSLDNKLLGNLQ
uniref:Uncharacterized protein n=1 Tax=viral metagenome TaxID=1070528 RepID=A0A6M3K5T5_9ZZZZ